MRAQAHLPVHTAPELRYAGNIIEKEEEEKKKKKKPPSCLDT